MIYNIDDKFPSTGNWKYKGETIREVLQKDSGYIKDLIRLDDYFALSDECMEEAKRITTGHRDTWKKPDNPKMIFDGLKPYGIPYGFDFNDEEIQKKNKEKQNRSNDHH